MAQTGSELAEGWGLVSAGVGNLLIPFLWRWVHQLHRSPQRIEVITAFYKHPFELVADSILSSAILYLGLGLSTEAARGRSSSLSWASSSTTGM